jgi:hypothetical protein
MHRKDAIAWVLTVCAGSLRLSQAKTLPILVAAAIHVQRISLANIGRALDGAAKHQIKRCWRFCANPRVESADAMQGIVAQLLKKRKKKLLIAVDWVDIKGFQTLMASVVLQGRSIPLCWASTTNHVYGGQRRRHRDGTARATFIGATAGRANDIRRGPSPEQREAVPIAFWHGNWAESSSAARMPSPSPPAENMRRCISNSCSSTSEDRNRSAPAS